MKQKIAEIEVNGLLYRARSVPAVQEESGAIVMSFDNGIIVRLAPDVARMVRRAHENWEYEAFA